MIVSTFSACSGGFKLSFQDSFKDDYDQSNSASLNSNLISDNDTVSENAYETPSEPNNVITYKEMSLDNVASQCSGCDSVIKLRIALTKVFRQLRTSDDYRATYLQKLDEIETKINQLMQHDCHAETVYVKDYPFIFNDYYGTYTGYWKGSGPVGKGTFLGKKLPKEARHNEFIGNMYDYTGDWNYGLPDGQGQYHFEEYCIDEDDVFGLTENYNFAYMDYVGGMKAGQRNGQGTEYKTHINTNNQSSIEYYFATANYSNNQLVGQVDFLEYDGDGTLVASGSMVESEGGKGTDFSHLIVKEYTYNEEFDYQNENIKQKIAGAVAVVAGAVTLFLTAYMGAKASSEYEYQGKSTEEQMAELDEYRKQQEEENQRLLEEQQNSQEEYRQYCEYKYNQLHKQDPTDSSRDAQYFKANMYS